MADNEDATNELIARILAADDEQQGYGASYEEFGDGEASDDSDFGCPRTKRTKRGKGSLCEARLPRGGIANHQTEASELTATGRRKRKDVGARREQSAKGWTEEEERLFLEGLELYGREWHKAAAHVGTRDKKAFTSHAQKHFIKLCIADKPLPERVIATGAGDGKGYTLSGLLLDPHSASAKSYGLKPDHLERLMASGGPGAEGLLLPGNENVDLRAARSRKAGKGDAAGSGSTPDTDDLAKPKPPSKAMTEAAEKPEMHNSTSKPLHVQEAPREPSEYVKNRPRREGAGMKSRWGHTSESLELVQCREFMGPPGSGAALAQPFEVIIDGKVNLMVDFHAHLCGCEIIGLLGGRWDPAERRIRVMAAYPCKRLAGSHSGTSVEVAPEAQLLAQERMEKQGLTSVGWYHSHPIFAPLPSQKDNENQRNQQVLHRCGMTGLEPCIGIIAGPYDQTLPSEASLMTYFVVQSRSSDLVPFRIRVKAAPSPGPLPDPELEEEVKALIDEGSADPDRIKLGDEWRPFRLFADSQGSGMRLTYLMKMRLAISHHLKGEGTDPEKAAEFLDRVFSHLKATWGFEAKPNDAPSATTEEGGLQIDNGSRSPQ